MSAIAASLAAERTFRARRSGWWVSLVAHGGAVVALVIVGSRPHHEAPNTPPAVVEFDAPPPPPRAVTPPPPPPPEEVPTPQPAVQHEEPVHHATPPRAARVVAPPPIMTAPAAGGDSNNAMESGTNTAFHGGDVGEPHEAPPTPAPVAPPAPPAPVVPVARGPVQLPENASPPEPEDGNSAPEYPASARASGVQATVIARIVVNDDGSVGRVEILRGHPDFNSAVEAALRRWRYRPARVDGHPLAVFQVVRVPFRLENL